MTKLLWAEPEPSPLAGFGRRFVRGLVWVLLAAGIGLLALGRILARDASSLLANPVLLLDLLRQPVVLGGFAAIVAMLATSAAVDEWQEVTARRTAPAPAAPAPGAPTIEPAATARRRLTVGSVVQGILVVGLAIAIVVFRPLAWGGSTSYAVVVGVSMEPTMRTGDLAIVMRQDTYAIGDVVSYHPSAAPEGEILHRVVGGDAASGWVTKGDNRPDADPDRSTTANIVGKVVLHLPMAGFLVNSLRNPYVLGVLVALLVMAVAWDLVATRARRTGR